MVAIIFRMETFSTELSPNYTTAINPILRVGSGSA
jgi:hypothetical protein